MFDEILQIVMKILRTSQNTEDILSFFQTLQDDDEFVKKMEEFSYGKGVGWIELCSIIPRKVYYIYINNRCLNGMDPKAFKERFSNEYFTDANFSNVGKYISSANLLKEEGNLRYQAVVAKVNANESMPFSNDSLEFLSANFPIIYLSQNSNDNTTLKKKYGYKSSMEDIDLEKALEYKKIKDWIIDYSKFHNAYTNFALTITLGYEFFDAVVHIGFFNIENTAFPLSLCNLWENICRLYVEKKLKRESIKSAVSAIMARNMSHNLGSHFISNTKNYFGKLADDDNDEQKKKDYRGIKHTLQYIQERMDFIATIVSSDRFPYGPVNVKSQIFDELTPDEFGYRHGKNTTNFLLDFLVYSEAISKRTNKEYSNNKTNLTLELITKERNTLYRFGATPASENKEAREFFAKINLAVPGGILGRHAIFTIIENIIRNSSKHDKGSIPSRGLNMSIRLNIDNDNASNIVIFDNKGNADKVKNTILNLYQETQILEENGSIDKGNKGLKEMLIATLWLNNVNLSEWLAKYDSLKNNKHDKLEMLGQYLEILSVDSNGEENTAEASHLGYKIKIKSFKPVYSIDPSEKDFILYKDIADVNADIVTADKDYYVLTNEDEKITENITPKLSTVFPRFVESEDGNDPVSLMKKSLVKRGLITQETLNSLSIDIIPTNQKVKPINKLNKYNIYSRDSDIAKPSEVDIIYKSHLSVNEDEIRKSLDRYPNAKYIDSISGGDFTHTLTEEFFLEDELNRLKIIESALCKIVIVDERIFNNYAHGQMPQEKNPKIIINSDKVIEIKGFISELRQRGELLVKIASEIESKYHIKLSTSDILSLDSCGCNENAFQKLKQQEKTESQITGEYKNYHEFLERKGIYIYNILPVSGEIITTDGMTKKLDSEGEVVNSPTFFSIHLSLIESLIKERQLASPNTERSFIIRDIIDSLETCFGNPKFMIVHSGRGNLSDELEKELKDKAFMSLSAIEASLYDSKYFLTQLLCSNCYFGKGKINL